ncbi:MAG: AN1-type zinc finger domain-containing protein [Nitrososphaerales archaeon]
MVSCSYCSKVEALPYQCGLCSRHFCSAHKEPQSHQCVQDADSTEQRELTQIQESRAGLPYFIHAQTNVPYLVGRNGNTVIAVQMKRSGWKLRLQRRKKGTRDIIADKDGERWYIRIKTFDETLSAVLRNIPISSEVVEEVVAISERKKALPVIALVASDSVVMVSAKTFTALSP